MAALPTHGLAVLFSGGLDSAILLGQAVQAGRRVIPLFIRSGLLWQRAELAAAWRFVEAVASPNLAPLVVLDLPLADLYADHWSLTGDEVPDASSPDHAVYLPGRNALLVVKAAVWCQLHAIGELAIGVLRTSPFADAKRPFFDSLEAALNCPPANPVRLTRPFGEMNKPQVMLLGHELPLDHTFSCLAPVGCVHCGVCNKCAERKAAFAAVQRDDPTPYASAKATTH
jgi:7-cyano-7-deazaguanine synthase